MMSPCRVFTAIAYLSVAHGALIWDGRFNDVSSAVDLNRWSWANQVFKCLPYRQYHSIHASGGLKRIHGNSGREITA